LPETEEEMLLKCNSSIPAKKSWRHFGKGDFWFCSNKVLFEETSNLTLTAWRSGHQTEDPGSNPAKVCKVLGKIQQCCCVLFYKDFMCIGFVSKIGRKLVLSR
jgi:hypothetical protein